MKVIILCCLFCSPFLNACIFNADTKPGGKRDDDSITTSTPVTSPSPEIPIKVDTMTVSTPAEKGRNPARTEEVSMRPKPLPGLDTVAVQ